MIRIVLAGEPAGKGRPRFARMTGRAYTPEKTRSYEAQLSWAAQIVMRGAPLLTGPLSVVVLARKSIPASFSKTKRAAALLETLRPTTKPDVDNMAKMLDALNKIIWLDDAQIVDLRVSKTYSEKPELIIEITPLTELL